MDCITKKQNINQIFPPRNQKSKNSDKISANNKNKRQSSEQSIQQWKKQIKNRSKLKKKKSFYEQQTANKQCCKGCPNWLLISIALVALIGLIIVIYFYLKSIRFQTQVSNNNSTVFLRSSNSFTNSNDLNNKNTKEMKCIKNFFLYNGECIMCPNKSTWNGTNCILIST